MDTFQKKGSSILWGNCKGDMLGSSFQILKFLPKAEIKCVHPTLQRYRGTILNVRELTKEPDLIVEER